MEILQTPIPESHHPYDDNDFKLGLCNIAIAIEKAIFDKKTRFG